MKYYEGFIGQKFAHRLDDLALAIGDNMFTRRELVEIAGVGNFTAARNLSIALEIAFRPKNVEELSKRMDLDMLKSLDRIGDTAVFVWCHTLEALGLDVDAWFDLDLSEEASKQKTSIRLVTYKGKNVAA